MRDLWNLGYCIPQLAFQCVIWYASYWARSVRFAQLFLSFSGIYWVLVIYYVQIQEKDLFCDLHPRSKCSYVFNSGLNRPLKYLGVMSAENPLNRPLPEPFLLYYIYHCILPLLSRIPKLDLAVEVFSLILTLGFAVYTGVLCKMAVTELNDFSIILFVMCGINIMLLRPIYLYLARRFPKKRHTE